MEIIHNQKTTSLFSLSATPRSNRDSDTLKEADKALLSQVSAAFTIITGGHFKTRRQSA